MFYEGSGSRQGMAARSPEPCAPISCKQALDQTALAQPRKGSVDLVDRNVFGWREPPLADPLRGIAGKGVVAPVKRQ